jgi:hypothetical protein
MTRKESPGQDQRTGGNSQDANNSSLGPGAAGGDAEPLTLDEVLDTLDRRDGEYAAVCHKPVGGLFSSSVVTSADARARVESLAPQSDTWFSVNPTAGPANKPQADRERVRPDPRRFARLFDNPLLGYYAPLVLRWADDQLQPVADRLAAVLPPDLTKGMRLSIAACARSIATERALTGSGVRYPRGKDAYRVPSRYRCGDPRQTWYYVTGSMDILTSTGLIEHELGQWFGGAAGLQSVAWPTDYLMALVGPLIDVDEQRTLSSLEETIVLRDRQDKRDLDYDDTVETTTMRGQLATVNDELAKLEVRSGGIKVHIPVGRRIFNGSFERGGRFYCHGPSFQNMPTEERRNLELVIDGIAHQMVEIDYSNLHIEMAYRESRKRMRARDQYGIEGFDRALVKVAVNTVLNARTQHCGVLAVADELFHNRELRAASRIAGNSRSECRGLAKKVVAAIMQKHRRIGRYFGSDCGARFQRRDSDMATQIMLRMIRRTRRCPLPVHDSFLVADIDTEALVETMREVAEEYKLHPTLKVLRPSQPTTFLFHKEVTAPDLRRQEVIARREIKPLRRGFAWNGQSTGNPSGKRRSGFHYGHGPPASADNTVQMTRLEAGAGALSHEG